jgi:predicted Zn-dependent protease
LLTDLARTRPRWPRVYGLLAKSYAALGQRTEQHRALAEFYYLQGGLASAIEQLRFAQTAGDSDFYTLSAVDARLRELRAQQAAELKERRAEGKR